MMELSKRLRAIASYIPPGSRVADIGGDHAWLMVALAEEGQLERGIVGEVRRGPYENARSNVKRFGCDRQVDVRLGDGLSVCQPGEVDVVVIAGMGGTLIREILQRGQERLVGVQRLVLQPNVAAKQVRQWLLQHGWRLVDEELICDQSILYEIVVAEPGEGEAIDEEWLLEVGPLLWKKRHPLLHLRLREMLDKAHRILSHLPKAQQSSVEQKRNEMKQKVAQIERMMRCLSEEAN